MRIASALGAAAVLVAAAGACGGGAEEPVPKILLSQDGAEVTTDASPVTVAEVGDDLSELTFDLFEGGSGAVGDYRGTPLVVNFFASWCPPCVREMPDFQAAFEQLDGKVAFLGLSQDKEAADALGLVESTGVAYDVGWDRDLEVYRATGSSSMPTTALVTASGELADVFAGALDRHALLERIAGVLGVTG